MGTPGAPSFGAMPLRRALGRGLTVDVWNVGAGVSVSGARGHRSGTRDQESLGCRCLRVETIILTCLVLVRALLPPADGRYCTCSRHALDVRGPHAAHIGAQRRRYRFRYRCGVDQSFGSSLDNTRCRWQWWGGRRREQQGKRGMHACLSRRLPRLRFEDGVSGRGWGGWGGEVPVSATAVWAGGVRGVRQK